MINLREMPYVRILADAMVNRYLETGITEIQNPTPQGFLDYIDSVSYEKVTLLWKEYVLDYPAF